MRPLNLNSVFYSPDNPPSDNADINRYLVSEFSKIQAAITALSLGHIDMTYVAPSKPREGDIRLADGTSWNPGSGKGVYCYYNSAWKLLG